VNPTLRRFVIREAREGRRILAVTGARLLDREDMRPVVQTFLREQLSLQPSSTLYVSGGCEGSPDVWGHRIAYECGILDHLMLLINGQWRHYHRGQVVYQGVWTTPAFPAGGHNRNAAMVDALGLFRAYKAVPLLLGCQARWSPGGGTGQTLDLAKGEKPELPTVRASFYFENGTPKYEVSAIETNVLPTPTKHPP
jgi:hypothetical protein